MFKKILFSIIIIVVYFLGGCKSTPDISKNNVSEEYNYNIITIDPTTMVRPTENRDAMIVYNMGTYAMSQNLLQQAELLLLKAIELDTEFIDAMDHLGIVYRRQSRYKEAEEMYLKSIGLNDNNKVPYINLAVIYGLQGKLNDALELYKKVIEIDHNDPEGYFGVGSINYIIKDYDASITFLSIAEDLYKKNNSPFITSVYYYKGLISYNLGNFDDALWYLEEARKGNLNNETIERTINDINSKKE
ncbi:MAG: tetratricopeptide repeat protein [Treponema sp.]|nr:tetratricopeptide repeat protein [Treponema sp.]